MSKSIDSEFIEVRTWASQGEITERIESRFTNPQFFVYDDVICDFASISWSVWIPMPHRILVCA